MSWFNFNFEEKSSEKSDREKLEQLQYNYATLNIEYINLISYHQKLYEALRDYDMKKAKEILKETESTYIWHK